MELNTCSDAFAGVTGQTFASFINTLIVAQCALSSNEKYPKNYAPDLTEGEEFDFVIVGAGSAGSILANRLSENPKWKILLIEAGGYPSMNTKIPKMFFTAINSTEDWNYATEPSETACVGLNNKQCLCPKGKVLGGSSSIHGMIYKRGNRKDFDTWAAQGNEGWDYNSVITYFKKFEDLEGVEDELMGKNGELKITKPINKNNPREIFLEAYKEMGIKEYSEDNPNGYLDLYTNIDNGTRSSPATAFLHPMKNRKNAFLVINAQVSRVMINSDSIATGVEMRINDDLITVKATKEVILSAGSVGSPQILMNSGIGPKEHLEELGIPVVKNLRVGENLHDHVLFYGLMVKLGPKAMPENTYKKVMDDWYEYVMYRTGALSKTAVQNFVLFLNPKNNSVYPTLQMYYLPYPKNDLFNSLRHSVHLYNLPQEPFQLHETQNKESNMIYLMPSLSYPKSVGKILLRSKDPFDKPKIWTNYFSDEGGEDLQTLLEGIRFFQKLVKTKAFSAHEPEIVHLDLKNCREYESDSDDYWYCAFKNIGTTVYHLAGTCKMGPESDPNAVVDSRLRVYGVKRLRVVDASIMPSVISCNINAATIMIGQKASEMIIEDWSRKHTEL
ncbi:hypothetical protein FQR65_LT05008 [Abscondita terminalis]|nr:hypothetical protein FQR65_LT05008 [Abscondita terminalis]